MAPVRSRGGAQQVWARAAWLAPDIVRAVGLPVHALFTGLPFDERALRSELRVPWDHYVLLLERATALIGGLPQLELTLETMFHRVVPEVRTLAGIAVTPRRLARFVFEVLDPFLYPMLAFRLTDLGDDRMRIECRLAAGYRPCEPFFVGSRGALRSLTRHLDLPPLEILAEDVGPTHGVYEVQLPDAPSFAQRMGRIPSAVRRLATRALLGATRDGRPVSVQLDEHAPDPLVPRLVRATAAWQLSSDEVDLLRLAAAGFTDEAIADTLDRPRATIGAELDALAAKAGAASRADLVVTFWTQSLDG
jgi:hypothetical protein